MVDDPCSNAVKWLRTDVALLAQFYYSTDIICMVFPRIEAWASISFRALFDPASKQGQPLYVASLYLHMCVRTSVIDYINCLKATS